MNKKTKTYLLLIFVLGIWGTIGYKIINGLSTDVPEMALQDFDATFTPKANTKTEVFSIENAERDPFLGTLSYNLKKKSNPSKGTKPKKAENMPIITYGGLVKKQSSLNQIFVVNINSKQYLLKKGQTVDSIKLIKGNTKEIVISYNNKSKTVKRQ